MPLWPAQLYGSEFERIAAGELASTTEARLKALGGWGGFSSFMTPAALAAGVDAEIEPVGQVVGLATGSVRPGYQRTTRPGQGRAKVGVARWREHTGPLTAWTALRSIALGRLTKQAALLGANAVIGIVAERSFEEHEGEGEEAGVGVQRFTGTAVRVRAWRGADRPPVLTLSSPQELWAMLRAGVEPVGIAGGFASVHTSPSSATVRASLSGRRSVANVELGDLTESVREVRRLAMERLAKDARGLKADGLLGVNLELDDHGAGGSRMPGLRLTAHVLGSAIRRPRTRSPLTPAAVVRLTEGADG